MNTIHRGLRLSYVFILLAAYLLPGSAAARQATLASDSMPGSDGAPSLRPEDWNVDDVGQIDGNMLAVAVQGNRAYLGVWDKLVVADISNPAAPVVLGETQPFDGPISNIVVAGNTAYVTLSYSNSLQLVDISDPANPAVAGLFATPDYVWNLAVAGSYAYLANWTEGMRVLDVSDPANPVQVGLYDTPPFGYVIDVAVQGWYAYVGDVNYGLRVVDISDPANPVEVGSYDSVHNTQNLEVSGAYAYVATANGMLIMDVSNPAYPFPAGYYPALEETTLDVAVSGMYAYVVDRLYGLYVVDLWNPTTPVEAGYYGGIIAGEVVVSGDYAYVVNEGAALLILQFTGGVSGTGMLPLVAK